MPRDRFIVKVDGTMRSRPILPAWCAGLCALGLLLSMPTEAGQAGDLRFEAILVWATNAEKSPNPDHKPVETEVRRKLHELPLKWKHYFEVSRKQISVSRSGSGKASLSKKCELEVTDVDGEHVEVALIGKGEPVLKRTQALPKGEMLVLGGNAPDETGWLVVLKRTD